MATERRAYQRFKIRVPIEMFPDSSTVPIRGETTDLSAGGCYVESLFPLELGTALEVRLRVAEETLIATADVTTCDRQVGNGIRFVKMLPEDREHLRAYLEAVKSKTGQEQESDASVLNSGLEILPNLHVIR